MWGPSQRPDPTHLHQTKTNPNYGNGLHSPLLSSNTNAVPTSNDSSAKAVSPTAAIVPVPPFINQTSLTPGSGNLRSHDSACFAAWPNSMVASPGSVRASAATLPVT